MEMPIFYLSSIRRINGTQNMSPATPFSSYRDRLGAQRCSSFGESKEFQRAVSGPRRSIEKNWSFRIPGSNHRTGENHDGRHWYPECFFTLLKLVAYLGFRMFGAMHFSSWTRWDDHSPKLSYSWRARVNICNLNLILVKWYKYF